jgi:hypothetical protein
LPDFCPGIHAAVLCAEVLVKTSSLFDSELERSDTHALCLIGALASKAARGEDSMTNNAKFVIAGFVIAAAAAVAPAATAQPPQCPKGPGWFLSEPSPGDVVVDRNGNGLICVIGVHGRGSSRDVPGFSVTDDLGR